MEHKKIILGARFQFLTTFPFLVNSNFNILPKQEINIIIYINSIVYINIIVYINTIFKYSVSTNFKSSVGIKWGIMASKLG